VAVRNVDVVIIGLGVMGSACAGELAERGLRVLAADRFPRGRSRGSSAGSSRVLRTFHPGRPALVPLAEATRERWCALGEALLEPTGVLFAGRCDDVRWMQAVGPVGEILDERTLVARFPGIRWSAGAVAVYEADAGVLRADRCVYALQERAIRAGAHLRFGADAWLQDPHAVTARVGDEVVRAKQAVVAAGPWAPELGLAIPELTVRRVPVHWARGDAAARLLDRMPVCVFVEPNGSFGVMPWMSGEGAKYGRLDGHQPTDPDTVVRSVTAEEVARDARLLQARIPALECERSSAVCLETHTADGTFAIGFVAPRVLLVSACSGYGFKFAPVIGQIAADLLVSGHTAYDIATFSVFPGG
jgi:sarcosine oxidase